MLTDNALGSAVLRSQLAGSAALPGGGNNVALTRIGGVSPLEYFFHQAAATQALVCV
tara:strand:- start:602 stop:772 length:171 start_codon:yes stop_codon:yes gene_type:complete